jgi:CheY-like chemotaxis protein
VRVGLDVADEAIDVVVRTEAVALAPRRGPSERPDSPSSGSDASTRASVSRSIVADHGGELLLEDAPDGTTRSVLRLPRFAPNVYRVLVVDGDPIARRGLATDLRLEGFDVIAAADLFEATQLLRSHPVHVVLSDLQLADGGGELLVLRLRAEGRGSKIVVSSREVDSVTRHDVDGVLAKPWERKRLAQLVRALCVTGVSPRPAAPP